MKVRGYPVGTQVQEKHGYVKQKLEDGKWSGRGRCVFIKNNPDKRLTEHDRVFHKNGDRADDSLGNLVAIRFNGTRYNLSHSRVLWMPKLGKNITIDTRHAKKEPVGGGVS